MFLLGFFCLFYEISPDVIERSIKARNLLKAKNQLQLPE